MILLVKEFSKDFYFVPKMYALISFMFALILVLIYVVLFVFTVDKFVNHYFRWINKNLGSKH